MAHPEEPTAEFPGSPESVRAARLFVEDALAALGGDPVVDQVVLLTSELATNVVLHARSGFTVTVSRRGTRIRVAVADASGARPLRRRFGTTSGTGRGIAIVEDMSADWGVDRAGDGKVVWFEIEAAAPVTARAAAHVGAAPGRDDTVDLDALLQQFPDVDDVRGPQNLVGAGR